MEIRARGAMDPGCCGEEGAVVVKKDERQRGAQMGTYKKNFSPKPWVGK